MDTMGRTIKGDLEFLNSSPKNQSFCQSMPVPCQVLSADGRLAAVNGLWSDLTGYREQDMLGHRFDDLITVPEREAMAAFLDECVQAETSSTGVFTLIRANGSAIPISLAAKAKNLDGGDRRIICTITDLSVSTAAIKKEKRRHFQAIIDAAEDIIFVLDSDLRFRQINPAFERTFNLSSAEILGKTVRDIMEEKQAAALQALERQVLTGRVVRSERRLVIGGGEYVKNIVLTPLTDEAGDVAGICGIVRDVTSRKRAEENLQASLQMSADIVASIPSGLFICRYEAPDGLFLTGSNPEAEAMTGISTAKLGGRPMDELLPEARRLGLYADMIRVMDTGQTYRSDSFAYKDDRFDMVARIRAFRMPNNLLGVAFEDVTERTRAYEILHASEKRYRFLFRNTPVMMHSIDAEGKIVNVSDYWLETMGYTREEVIGRKSTAFLTPASRKYAEENVLPEFFVTGVCRNIHYQMVKKNGETIDVLLSAAAERSAHGAFERSLAAITDVTPLKRAENAASRFARALEQSLSTVLIVNLEGRIEYVNRHYTVLSRKKAADVIGKHFDSLTSNIEERDEYRRIWRIARAHGGWSGTLQTKRPNGEVSWGRGVISAITDESGRVTGYLVTTDDITAEIQMQQRLGEADKLSAVGLLAAGVAHEFKNYLCGIIGNASFTLDETQDSPASPEIRQTLLTIINIAERANNLATSLLTYSKAPTDSRRPEDLRELVTGTFALVAQELRKSSIEVITHFDNIPSVEVCSGSFQQLLLNLLINARQSISSHGIITVTLSRKHDTVVLKVGDSGYGIPADIMPRIFDPFFSTKGVWGDHGPGGVGMGLPVCRNIAREHGGDIVVDSLVGIGTVFTLILPITPQGGTARMADLASTSPRRIVICTRDTGLVNHYLPEALRLDCHLYWVNDMNGKESVCGAADLLIRDHDLGRNTSVVPETIDIPTVIIRRGTDLTPLPTNSIVYEGTPSLDDIAGAVAAFIPAAIKGTPSRPNSVKAQCVE